MYDEFSISIWNGEPRRSRVWLCMGKGTSTESVTILPVAWSILLVQVANFRKLTSPWFRMPDKSDEQRRLNKKVACSARGHFYSEMLEIS